MGEGGGGRGGRRKRRRGRGGCTCWKHMPGYPIIIIVPVVVPSEEWVGALPGWVDDPPR